VATERLLSRVLPEVAGQLVRPCKFPSATIPRTLVRLFTCATEAQKKKKKKKIENQHHWILEYKTQDPLIFST
jgi:hypothetical protein